MLSPQDSWQPRGNSWGLGEAASVCGEALPTRSHFGDATSAPGNLSVCRLHARLLEMVVVSSGDFPYASSPYASALTTRQRQRSDAVPGAVIPGPAVLADAPDPGHACETRNPMRSTLGLPPPPQTSQRSAAAQWPLEDNLAWFHACLTETPTP